MEHIKITCPSCGKELELPEGLEEFSCLYCGTRTRLDALFARQRDPEALSELREGLRRAATGYPDFYKKLGKKEFFPAFARYEKENTQVLRLLDELAGGDKQFVSQVCSELMDDIDAFLRGDKRYGKRSGRSAMFFEEKVVLAIFLTPLAKKLELACAEPFRAELHAQWLARYPKEIWTPGDYDVMASGYRKRKFCFITTAVCEHEGKGDDCAELTAFRAFRDGWLRQNGGGELIDTYYDIAPAIVACIDLLDKPEERYAQIRARWLTPCYTALLENRPADCRNLYVDMVKTLERTYFS